MKCSSRCLGHAPQQTVEVICARCQETKWVPDPIIPLTADGRVAGPPIPLELPYTCQRCRAVLAGRSAPDPLPTEARRAAGARLAATRTSLRVIQPCLEAPNVTEEGSEPSLTIRALDLQEPERRACRCSRGCCAICNPSIEPEARGLPADWAKLSASVRQRDGYRCKHCGKRERLTVHHVVPRDQ